MIHRFNLCVTSAVDSSRITQILTLAEDSAKIFRGSYKRMDVWIDAVISVPGFNSQRRLKLIGKTRWSSKQDAIHSIIGDEKSLYVLIKALLKICSLDNLQQNPLINTSNTLNSWLRYDNVVIVFLLHKVFSSITPTTKFLQKMGLNILAGFRSLKECKQKLEDCTESLDNYIEQADRLIKDTNLLLLNDEEITALDCDCYISLPMEEEKQRKINRIKKIFHVLIQKLRDEIDEKILFEFDDPGSLLYEMMFLDPLTAEKTFSGGENSVSLTKLCRINNISNENFVIEELKKFTTEFTEHLNRRELVSLLNDNNGSELRFPDQNDDLLIQSGNDFEIQDEIESGQIQPVSEKKCECVECILKYISSNQERSKAYARVFKLYKYIATLPSTQVKCERDFSKLKLTKTRLRSSLCEKSLENLMLISVESAMFKNINLDDIVGEIIASSSRMTLYVGGG